MHVDGTGLIFALEGCLVSEIWSLFMTTSMFYLALSTILPTP